MDQTSGLTDCEENLERYIQHLKQEGRECNVVRRNTLKVIYDDLKALNPDKSLERGDGVDGCIQKVVKLLPPVVILRLSDNLERCRELAYEILQVLLLHMTNDQVFEILPHLIPKLVERLGQEELIESSEEVRWIAVTFMEALVEKLMAEELLTVYIDDFLMILSRTITDDFFSVIHKSCKVASDLAKSHKKVFHYNGERLIRPLCLSITHQRYSVRQSCVRTIGDVILYGNHKSIELVLPHITQRLFDSTPQVRKEVVTVVGSWMLAYVDRYSYFHKFLPLLMTGLGDESPDVERVATKYWSDVGTQYLNENIEEYKDQADFPTPIPAHYPAHVSRPNLGCRLLAHQHVSKLLPGIENEITDWVVNTRIKSAQLLYHLILNSEDKATMHTAGILQCLFKASLDEEPVVSKSVVKSSKLIGYFIPFSIYWPIVVLRVKSTTNASGLIVAAGILKGTSPDTLEENMKEVMEFLTDKEICQSMNSKIQMKVLDICSIIVNVKLTEDVPYGIFKVLVTILAITNSTENSGIAYDLLRSLEKALDLSSFTDLMSRFSARILDDIKQSSEWTPLSADKLIFDLVLSHGGIALSNNTEVILEIMKNNLSPDKDPEVRLKVFTMLARHLTCQPSDQRVQDFLKRVIEDILNPNLIWTAGKTACALRTAATSCLHACLECGILNSSMIVDILPQLEATLFMLAEDNPEMTRVLACESLRLAVEYGGRKISPDHLHKIYPVMLKRMDDVSNKVRTSAACTIAAVFNNVPLDYDVNFYKLHIQNVYEVLVVHLDTEESEIQEVVFDTLQEIGKLLPLSLLSECKKMKSKHRSPDLCDKLIKSFSELSSGNSQ